MGDLDPSQARSDNDMVDSVWKIITAGCEHPSLADEVYCQIIKQLTNNRSQRSYVLPVSLCMGETEKSWSKKVSKYKPKKLLNDVKLQSRCKAMQEWHCFMWKRQRLNGMYVVLYVKLTIMLLIVIIILKFGSQLAGLHRKIYAVSVVIYTWADGLIIGLHEKLCTTVTTRNVGKHENASTHLHICRGRKMQVKC